MGVIVVFIFTLDTLKKEEKGRTKNENQVLYEW